MDNAQKAIMIGVGLFITIIIISAVLLITNLGTDLINNARNQMSNISKSLQNQVTSAQAGGVTVTYKTSGGSETAYAELDSTTRNSLSQIQATGGVSGTQTYYSYVMKDQDSDTVMGVLFIRKGI